MPGSARRGAGPRCTVPAGRLQSPTPTKVGISSVSTVSPRWCQTAVPRRACGPQFVVVSVVSAFIEKEENCSGWSPPGGIVLPTSRASHHEANPGLFCTARNLRRRLPWCACGRTHGVVAEQDGQVSMNLEDLADRKMHQRGPEAQERPSQPSGMRAMGFPPRDGERNHCTAPPYVSTDTHRSKLAFKNGVIQ
jgi:hypothetical protein